MLELSADYRPAVKGGDNVLSPVLTPDPVYFDCAPEALGPRFGSVNAARIADTTAELHPRDRDRRQTIEFSSD